MAYTYIDDGAWPGSTSDGPFSSAFLQQLRTNVAQIRSERTIRLGHAIHASASPSRLCSIWPCAWPLGYVYVDEESPSITARIEVADVTASVDYAGAVGAGTDLINVGLTVITPDGLGWGDLPEWTTLDSDVADDVITLTAPLHGRRGWLVVLLWTDSSPFAFEESGTGRNVYEHNDLGQVQVSSLEAIATLPCERAIRAQLPQDKVTYYPVGPLYQIEAWQTVAGTGEHVLEVWPPLVLPGDLISTGWSGAYAQVVYWVMGVITITGWSLEIDESSSDLPGPWSVETSAPISESTLTGVAQGLQRLTCRRVPQWGAGQPEHLWPGVGGSYWVRERHWDATETVPPDLATWVVVQSWVIASPPPLADNHGYEAMCVLRLKQIELLTCTLSLRLVAREIGSAAPATYATGSPMSWVVTPHCHHHWSPSWACFRLGDSYETYQHRGAMINTAFAGEGVDDQDRPSDMRAVYWSPPVYLADGVAIAYPCEIRLEMTVASMPVVFDIEAALVEAGLRCVQLTEVP